MSSFEHSFSAKDKAGLRFLRAVLKELRGAYEEKASHDHSALRSTAAALEIDRSAVWRRLRGEINMSAETIGQMAWALGLKPSNKIFEKRSSARDGDNRNVLVMRSAVEITSDDGRPLIATAPHPPLMVSKTEATKTVFFRRQEGSCFVGGSLMTERMPMPRTGHVTICDIIRREDNGKEIYIGVYAGSIVVPVIPFVTPHLAFALSVTGEADERPQKLMFAVEMAPTEKLEFEVPLEQMVAATNQASGATPASYYRVAITLQLSDVAFTQAGPLDCFMIDERGRHLIARYRIVEQPPSEMDATAIEALRESMRKRIEKIKALNVAEQAGMAAPLPAT